MRVLIDDSRWYQMTEMSSMGANWKIFETMQNKKTDKELLDDKAHSERGVVFKPSSTLPQSIRKK